MPLITFIGQETPTFVQFRSLEGIFGACKIRSVYLEENK